VCVTAATEPVSVGEHAVQRHAGTCRTGVVLRMGLVVGDSPLTRWSLRAAAAGRPVGFGDPEGFVHLVHSDDVGAAVAAALDAPSGVYNVGAEPVRRAELADGCAAAVGRDGGAFLGSWTSRLGRERLEPLRRSLRVSSARFSDATGWAPRRDRLDAGWFEAAGLPELVVR
jgi:nucleoside-diphosphate-sugar epimerase